jgi:CheY-like chemotaxis protein
LVVEDDAVSAAVITQHLVALGLANPVHNARDGDEAVAWLSKNLAEPTGTVPALVLLDRHLPGRDGLDVLRWMHGEPRLRPVPVLILTAGSDVDAISEAYSFGARSYLVKPIGFEALGEVVRGLDFRWAILSAEAKR